MESHQISISCCDGHSGIRERVKLVKVVMMVMIYWIGISLFFSTILFFDSSGSRKSLCNAPDNLAIMKGDGDDDDDNDDNLIMKMTSLRSPRCVALTSPGTQCVLTKRPRVIR